MECLKGCDLDEPDEFLISTVRDPFELIQINKLHSLWNSQGAPEWSSGVNDLPLFSLIDPDACLVGKLNGRIVCILVVVNYSKSYSFIGAFITDPKLRGNGYGSQLWKAGLVHCGKRQTGIYAVKSMTERYERDRFKLAGKVLIYKIDKLDRFDDPEDECVIDANTISLEEVSRFNRTTGVYYQPPTFIQAWMRQPRAVALAYKTREGLVGYGVIRRCYEDRTCKIGPLVATDSRAAGKILVALLSRVSDARVVMMEIFAENTDAVKMVENLDGLVLEENVVMFRNNEPSTSVTSCVYAVTSGVIG